MKNIVILIILKVILIIEISYSINQIPNNNNNDYMYMVKQWEYSNCTGEQVDFIAFSENQFYTELIDSFLNCDPTKSPISCNFTLNYNQNIINKNIIELKEGICNNFKTIEYIKNSDFDYNESKFCVMSEFSTCQYKPIFHLGTLRDVCVYGWLLKCSSLGYEIKHCKLLDFNDNSNYTLLDDDDGETFPAYVCKNSFENITSLSRGYIVHASTIDGINDPQYEKRILKLGPKSNHHFSNSSTSIFLFSLKKNIILIYFTTLIIIIFL
ncbi:hypothetical protein DDB_G0278787 [Dictyostelium discoideum AX4]|uniref:Uncharacterized protein n=1 Tax=Dictyostelium discoideum TaxID=44689 RepID=Q54XR8_DICDI|nr:hypothetical protein DDB_G0278787 [Dictyostelium discoideum AX4]EAL67995.1 hypothetical protein DDB_G0278787 [Dictyostelium discoideum AX4]|eukprot:XP_641962.1 hypothetical protein DDB_G0278787 [Dictyostelium discoideum AX4]